MRRRLPLRARHPRALKRPVGPQRRLQAVPPRPKSDRRTSSPLVMALLLAGWALALVLWFRPSPAPSAPPAVEGPSSPPVPRVASSAEAAHPAAGLARKHTPLAAPSVDRDALVAAMEARAEDLRACIPSGGELRLATRLVLEGSAVKAVEFANAEPPPPEVVDCARTRLLAWKFEGLPLPPRTDVRVSFALSSK